MNDKLISIEGLSLYHEFNSAELEKKAEQFEVDDTLILEHDNVNENNLLRVNIDNETIVKNSQGQLAVNREKFLNQDENPNYALKNFTITASKVPWTLEVTDYRHNDLPTPVDGMIFEYSLDDGETWTQVSLDSTENNVALEDYFGQIYTAYKYKSELIEKSSVNVRVAFDLSVENQRITNGIKLAVYNIKWLRMHVIDADCDFDVSGSLNKLIQCEGNYPICYGPLFFNSSVKSAENLVVNEVPNIPNKWQKNFWENQFRGMFANSKLVKSPVIPLTDCSIYDTGKVLWLNKDSQVWNVDQNLTFTPDNCFAEMFYDCKKLHYIQIHYDDTFETVIENTGNILITPRTVFYRDIFQGISNYGIIDLSNCIEGLENEIPESLTFFSQFRKNWVVSHKINNPIKNIENLLNSLCESVEVDGEVDNRIFIIGLPVVVKNEQYTEEYKFLYVCKNTNQNRIDLIPNLNDLKGFLLNCGYVEEKYVLTQNSLRNYWYDEGLHLEYCNFPNIYMVNSSIENLQGEEFIFNIYSNNWYIDSDTKDCGIYGTYWIDYKTFFKDLYDLTNKYPDKYIIHIYNKGDLYDWEFVDLGLPSGTLWSNKNLGAETETDFGNYYTRIYSDPDVVTQEGIDPSDSGIASPTNDQITELNTYTDRTVTLDYNNTGVAGTIFTSKVNDNYIFIPFSGYKNSQDSQVVLDNSKQTYLHAYNRITWYLSTESSYGYGMTGNYYVVRPVKN